MGRFLNPNNSAFQASVDSKIYVDKSGIINYTNGLIGTMQAFICNSRPRRFGKSITANMLTAYYSRDVTRKKCFPDLKLASARILEHI